jgi:hypothetical protein
MARRVNMTKMLQEIRSFAEISNRRPHPALAWGPPRPLHVRVAPIRRRLNVTIDPQDNLAREVKINRV